MQKCKQNCLYQVSLTITAQVQYCHYRLIITLFSLYCTNNIKILYYEYPITI